MHLLRNWLWLLRKLDSVTILGSASLEWNCVHASYKKGNKVANTTIKWILISTNMQPNQIYSTTIHRYVKGSENYFIDCYRIPLLCYACSHYHCDGAMRITSTCEWWRIYDRSIKHRRYTIESSPLNHYIIALCLEHVQMSELLKLFRYIDLDVDVSVFTTSAVATYLYIFRFYSFWT